MSVLGFSDWTELNIVCLQNNDCWCMNWWINRSTFKSVISENVLKLQGFRGENGGNWVPWTRGKYGAGRSWWSEIYVYVRRCIEAERVEPKNDIHTCHSAAKWSVHAIQQGRISFNTWTFFIPLPQSYCDVSCCWHLGVLPPHSDCNLSCFVSSTEQYSAFVLITSPINSDIRFLQTTEYTFVSAQCRL